MTWFTTGLIHDVDLTETSFELVVESKAWACLISIQLNLHDDSKLELEDEAPLWRIYHWYIEYNNLVGGLEHFLLFHILGIIIPIDKYFFRGVETTNQVYILYIYIIFIIYIYIIYIYIIYILYIYILYIYECRSKPPQRSFIQTYEWSMLL